MYLLVELGRIRQRHYLQIRLVGIADPQDPRSGFLRCAGSVRQPDDYCVPSTHVGRETITGYEATK